MQPQDINSHLHRYEIHFRDDDHIDLAIVDALNEAIAPLKAINDTFLNEISSINSLNNPKQLLSHLMSIIDNFIRDYEYIDQLRYRSHRSQH